MPANTRQIGGDHYKSEYQHWDFVIDTSTDYLLGCATKYVIRARRKNGVEDLSKARHYIEKIIEKYGISVRAYRQHTIDCTKNLLQSNCLEEYKEAEIIFILMGGSTTCNLEDALFSIDELIEELKDGVEKKVDNTGMEHPFGYAEDENEIPFDGKIGEPF